MTPILGITASSITAGLLGDYQSIATVTVTSATQASIEFANIPGTYKHLQLRAMILSSTGGVNHRVNFNNNTTAADYTRHILYGDGSSAASVAVTSTGFAQLSYTDLTTQPTVAIMDILDYTNTNKNTTTRSLYGNDFNGSGIVGLVSSLWIKTDAITEIDITPTSGSFSQNSSFALYGIK